MSFMGKMLGFGKRNKENLGVKVDPPNPQTAATTIQSSWRGKYVTRFCNRPVIVINLVNSHHVDDGGQARKEGRQTKELSRDQHPKTLPRHQHSHEVYARGEKGERASG